MKFGEEFAQKYDLSTLKVLGTVGEPINPEAWLWYHKYVGSENCSIVDTYWQVSYLSNAFYHNLSVEGVNSVILALTLPTYFQTVSEIISVHKKSAISTTISAFMI